MNSIDNIIFSLLDGQFGYNSAISKTIERGLICLNSSATDVLYDTEDSMLSCVTDRIQNILNITVHILTDVGDLIDLILFGIQTLFGEFRIFIQLFQYCRLVE